MFPDFLDQSSDAVARQLLGCELVREIDGTVIRARIVETESYDEADEASHTFRGKTIRNNVMYGPSGKLYVYFTYGMHYCCNVVTGVEGVGSAVLLRAVEPLQGIELMQKRRGRDGPQIANGPAKLCQALAIGREFNGHDLRRSPLFLMRGAHIDDKEVVQTTRIGISRARDAQKRWYIKNNRFVSRP